MSSTVGAAWPVTTMAQITLRILDGADRGTLFQALDTPVSIGREEGNTIQLNDDRVSRFHVKIQEDNDRVVLADLESTNGTKVNGEDVQLRILKHGDTIMVGRSVILFGSREEIAARLARLRGKDITLDSDDERQLKELVSMDFELSWSDHDELHTTLHTLEPPDLPDQLRPGQAAQLAEIIDYLHIRIRHLLATVKADDSEERVTLDQRQWQNLLDLQDRLACYQRAIGDPE